MEFTQNSTQKRLLALFVAIIMALAVWTATPLQASADETDGDYTFTISGTNATIVGYTGTGDPDGKLDIPSKLSANATEYTVTAIDVDAFASNTSITSVTIPESVVSIDSGAFSNCTSLETVNGMDGVTSMGDGVFYHCTSLETITISEKVTSIGSIVFVECNSLTAINVDAGNQNYMDDDGVLFDKNKTILMDYPSARPGETYTIPNSVETIDNVGMDFCASLKTVNIPDSVTDIGYWAFSHCESLETINGMKNVATISEGMFDTCSSLTSVTIPENAATIGGNAFRSCASLESITIPSSVEDIGGSAFWDCSDLASVTIENGVTGSIGQQAFYQCVSLDSITIPGGVTSIGAYAFYGCNALETATMLDGVLTISDCAFWYCTSLETVTIPASVTTMGQYAFAGNDALTTVTILGKTTVMGTDEYTFPDINTLTIWCYDGSTAETYVGTRSNINIALMIEGFELNKQTLTLDRDEGTQDIPNTDTLSVQTYLPGTQTETTTGGNTPTVTWESSNPGLVSVTNGVVSLTDEQGTGTAVITATIIPHSGATLMASCKVTVAPQAGTDTYALTVNNGDGGGSYAEGATVTITAGDPPVGQVFAGWTGADESSFADASEPTTVFTMPGAAAVVTAHYKSVYAVIVENGTDAGDGSYAAGDTVTIIANAPADGQVFEKWTATDGVIFANANSAETSFTMPAKPVTVMASYKPAPASPAPTTYAVTVTGGSGSGSYAESATVTITANAPAEGKVFDKWTSDDVTFATATSATTSFVMPAKAVTVTANYKDAPNGGGDDPNPPAADNGWVKNEDGEWEYLVGGEAKTGWLYDTNYKAWYYLAANGTMQTGWEYVGGKWYYLTGNGAMKTGWLKDNGSWYYLSGNGAMVVNKWFKDTDGSWYYLSGNGTMLTGKQNVGGKVYTFKANGAWIG
jgi:hypothetical protein